MKKILLITLLIGNFLNIWAQNVGIFENNPLNTLHIGTLNNPTTSSDLVDPNNLLSNVKVITPTIRIESLSRNQQEYKFNSIFYNLATNKIQNKKTATVPLSIDKNGEIILGSHFEDVNKNFSGLIPGQNNANGSVSINLITNFEIKTKSIVHLQANVATRNARNSGTNTEEYQNGVGIHRSYFKITNTENSQEIIAGLDEKYHDYYGTHNHKRPLSLTPQIYTVLEGGTYNISLITEYIKEDYSPDRDGSDVDYGRITFNPEVNAGSTYTKQGSNFTFNVFPL